VLPFLRPTSSKRMQVRLTTENTEIAERRTRRGQQNEEYRKPGPGWLESTYPTCLVHRSRRQAVEVRRDSQRASLSGLRVLSDLCGSMSWYVVVPRWHMISPEKLQAAARDDLRPGTSQAGGPRGAGSADRGNPRGGPGQRRVLRRPVPQEPRRSGSRTEIPGSLRGVSTYARLVQGAGEGGDEAARRPVSVSPEELPGQTHRV
jgi:hypothetical protein